MERHDLRYTGSPAFASLFVQMLEDEGATVEWERPMERRGLPEAAEAAVVTLAVWGTKAAIQTAIARFRKRWPKAEIDWREGDGYR